MNNLIQVNFSGSNLYMTACHVPTTVNPLPIISSVKETRVETSIVSNIPKTWNFTKVSESYERFCIKLKSSAPCTGTGYNEAACVAASHFSLFQFQTLTEACVDI